MRVVNGTRDRWSKRSSLGMRIGGSERLSQMTNGRQWSHVRTFPPTNGGNSERITDGEGDGWTSAME